MKRSREKEQSGRDACETLARQRGHTVIVSNLPATLRRSRDKCQSAGGLGDEKRRRDVYDKTVRSVLASYRR
jgi:hypothetical protein